LPRRSGLLSASAAAQRRSFMDCPLPSIPLPPRSAPSAAHRRAEIEIRDIGLSGIAVLPTRMRSLRPEVVDALAKSMKKQGLLQPIILRKAATGFYLVAGHHRYQAAKKLKWEAIRAQIFAEWEEDEALLAEIDENLIRADLSPAERAAHQAARKKVYQRAHPETKKGGDRQTPGAKKLSAKSALSFVEDTAARTGRSKRSIETDVARADAIGNEALGLVMATSLDKGTELDALAAMPAPERQAIISRAASGEEVSALQEAAAQTPRSGYFDLCRTWKSFRFAWLRANPAGREAFAEENFKQISGFVAKTEPKLSIEEENGIRIVESIIVLSAAVLSANEAAARLRTTDASALFVKERLPAALAWINEFSDALNKTGCEGGDGHG
jgi:ParB family chromosome partitioning protein